MVQQQAKLSSAHQRGGEHKAPKAGLLWASYPKTYNLRTLGRL